MSYLDEVKKDARAVNPFFRQMGIEVVGTAAGRSVLKMPVRPDMHNGVGWLQGGLLVALADEAMALAVYTQLVEGEGIATISESTSFIKGVRDGIIYAEGRVIRKGRRVAFCESEVWTGEGERCLLSRTSAAFAVMTKT
jgi:acyl-CoA thioesterase